MNTQLIIISSPVKQPSEIRKMVGLFKYGLKQFHIRKPDFSDFDMINFIGSIPTVYYKYLVLHSHYHLAEEFNCKGIQVGKRRMKEAEAYKSKFEYCGYSAHSFDEIIEHKEDFTHFFLSPVYDSISKTDYKSNFYLAEVSSFITDNPDVKLIALGGLDKSNSLQTLNLGFEGLAFLGSIWQAGDTALAYSEIIASISFRANVLSIAGFDPSSGAGVTADIKTFEQHKVQGLAVNTAITYQNETDFEGVDWMTFEQIKKQIEILFKKYQPEYIKIGLIESFDVLQQVVKLLKGINPSVKIIWDPILKASAGFDFHKNIKSAEVISLLQNIYLVTPNIPECKALMGTDEFEEIQAQIIDNKLCNVLVKGGHSENDKVTDVLIQSDNITSFEGNRLANTKHGTGCVLSSAIASNLANHISLANSIKKAKQYITQFIDSNNGLLGYHNL